MNGNEMNFEHVINRMKALIELLERMEITRLEALHSFKHIRHIIKYHSAVNCEAEMDKFESMVMLVVTESIKERLAIGKM